jgi:hypothetical protein
MDRRSYSAAMRRQIPGRCQKCAAIERAKTFTRKPGPSVEERFWRKVVVNDGTCWGWKGGLTAAGYGQISDFHNSPAKVYAHRLSYEIHVGPIPEGLVIDHLCRNRSCVNPEHLEVVTRHENNLRGEHPRYVAHRNGTCLHGHPQTYENTRRRSDGSRHSCLVCYRERKRSIK